MHVNNALSEVALQDEFEFGVSCALVLLSVLLHRLPKTQGFFTSVWTLSTGMWAVGELPEHHSCWKAALQFQITQQQIIIT